MLPRSTVPCTLHHVIPRLPPLRTQPLEYYTTNYPVDGPKVLGFLTYEWIKTLQLDHIYTAWYFYGSLGLLGASLMACTYTRQWPAVKVRKHGLRGWGDSVT